MNALAARFRPPPLDPPAELCWVMVRALGPADASFEEQIDPERAVEMADRLLVAPLIARRIAEERLTRDLGADLTARLRGDRLNDAAVQMQYRATCSVLADEAHALGVPLIFLKGLALQLGGLLDSGDRPVSDVDVLVPEPHALDLQRRLLHLGFRHGAPVSMAHPHHLPPLWSERWLAVEVHTALPGVAVRSGARFCSAEDLIDAQLTVPAPGLAGGALLPRTGLTAVHLVVHALVHHATSERFFFRLLGDLAAVLAHSNAAEIRDFGRFVGHLVPAEELHDLLRLTAKLVDGGDPERLATGNSPAALALRHFAALACNAAYRRTVRRSGLLLRHDTLDLGGPRGLPQLWWPRHRVLDPDGEPLSWPRWLAWNIGRPLRFVSRAAAGLTGRD